MNFHYTKHLLFTSICALFTLSTVAEAQTIFNFPNIGGIFSGRRSTRGDSSKPAKKHRTAEDVLNTPQDTSAFDPEKPLGNEFLRHSSRGWFPIPFSAHSIFLWGNIEFPLNFGSDLRFPSLPLTTNPFSFTDPYKDNDSRKPFKIGSRTEREGNYPTSYNDGIGVLYELSLPIPVMFRFGARYAWQGTMLYSVKSGVRYLFSNTVENPTSVNIINNLFVEEKRVVGLAGIKIPIYGVFADFVDQRVASYYYLALAANGNYTFWQNTLQYAHILTEDNQLRFPNRTDTLQRWNAPMQGFPQTRINVDVAVGWGVSGEVSFGQFQAGLAALMEIFCTIPTSQLIQGVEWRQYSLGARVIIGWHNRLGK